jgi:hypothetical protein
MSRIEQDLWFANRLASCFVPGNNKWVFRVWVCVLRVVRVRTLALGIFWDEPSI